jgi:hypothetical protein
VGSNSVSALENIDSKIIYGSLLIIVVLALLAHLTAGQIYSLATILLIIFVALGNIGYLYSKSKKTRK